MSVRANFVDIYLQGMHDRSMQSGMELAWEIQLTDWSTAGEQSKLVFVVSTKPSQAPFISLFTMGKKLSFDCPNHTSIQVFHFKISVKTKHRKQICALRENLSNRSSGLQIPHDNCTRFECHLYSMKCTWIIKCNIILESLMMNVKMTTIIIAFIKQRLALKMFICSTYSVCK